MRIEPVLPGKEGDPGRTATDNRWFVEAVLWIGRTGCPWRDLPSEFGRWDTVYMRFLRWRRKGVWECVTHAVSDETEIKRVLTDSAVVFAHQHSAGARKKGGPKGLDCSRGGLTTKLHLAIDNAGRPLRLIATAGQVTDITCANELVEHLRTAAVIADKGYDSDAFAATFRAAGAKVVIPPRSNRTTKRRYSRVLYRTRNIVERFFNCIKHFRRVATRYDKLAGNYLAFASLACAFGSLVRM